MEHHEQPFTPEQVDEQVEQRFSDLHTPEAQFHSEMQQVTRQIREEHDRSLQRVEQRLMKYAHTHAEYAAAKPEKQPSSPRTLKQGRLRFMEKKQASTFARRVTTLVAVFVMVLLVGSLLVVLNLSRQATGTGSKVTPTATATPVKTYSSAQRLCQFADDNKDVGSAYQSWLDWATDDQLAASYGNLANYGNLEVVDGATCTQKLHLDDQGTQDTNARWSPDHTRLLTKLADSLPKIVDASTGKVMVAYVPTFSVKGSGGYGNTMVTPWDSVWSPDGTQIISLVDYPVGHWIIQVWSASTGKVVSSTPLTQSRQPLGYVSLSPHGTYFAIDTGRDIAIWNIQAKKVVSHLPISVDNQHFLSDAWSADESMLALGIFNGNNFSAWSVSDGKQIASFADKNIGSLAWSPDGKYLAESNTMIHLWDVRTQKVVATFGDNQWIANLAWSQEGSKIASSAVKQGDLTKNTVSIWKLS
ncbi:WD40 repeat domain-containing protein [Ktedonobacter robiniae]|uniref:Anaphase-promoting complex subunit 4-like WD40 domain-containing protein n=1 Tax=Ktedonobacter robiniae TaxID=2778365 RepID=A0ABQ3UKE9_9CHLR|nr:PD40 domain-containing protein [Ktedonobacter robiniae]GHO53147.1 hypothetical protein KSB_16220 [Ktedonobacter robiniae]